MAAIKHTVTPHGVTANYWKLMSCNVDVVKDRVEMRFAIYASAEARDNGSIPLWNEYVTFVLSEITPSPLEVFYNLAMKSEKFAGATSDVQSSLDLFSKIPEVRQEPVQEDPTRAAALAAARKLGGK